MILVIDNHGFTTNILIHQLGAVHVVSATELAALNVDDYTHVVVTHGPQEADLRPLTAAPQLPVLAIGAGYQQLATAYGHTTVGLAQPIYGQPVVHQHTDNGLFADVPNPTSLVSYHPWRLTAMDPETFVIHAADADAGVLAYRVNETNHWGLHADPAAFQSAYGSQVVENFLALAPVGPPSTGPRRAHVPASRSVGIFTRRFPGTLNTPETFRRLEAGTSAAFWLDSAAAHRGQGETTVMGTNAGPLAQTVRWDAETNLLEIFEDGSTLRRTGDVLTYLEQTRWKPSSVQLPGFTGGWVGYLGYEAKQSTMARHRNHWQARTPDAYWIRPQAFLRYDHRHEVTTLFAVDDAALLDDLEATLVWGTSDAPAPCQRRQSTPGRWRLDATAYQHRVAAIQQLLHTGQAAGICLTDTYEHDAYSGDGLELYMRLRSNNPAPYAGYLRLDTFDDELEVLSASPEKFLSIDDNGRIESKPIKGTVARDHDPTVDAHLACQMAADPKIQSENLMITDLLRDDIADVALPGSRDVPKLMAVESFATVHQLVTTVTGQLEPHTSATSALRAVFPGGSMTGAPKLASVEALDSLEAGPRGIYSGVMGWLGDNNTAEFNVLIRSMVLHEGQLSLGAGGAVVVDSDPVAEDQEKQLKARALLDTIAELA